MALTKSTFRMTNGDPVNVLDYGAKGDGVTDDTAAIQAALNASINVYIPYTASGYALSGTILLDTDYQSITLHGSLFRTGTSTAPIIRIDTAYGFVIGDGKGRIINTVSNSPNGLILFGPEDPSTTDHTNILFGRIDGVLLFGDQSSNSKGIAFHTREAYGGSQANYFNTIHNCVINDVHEGIYLMRVCNGHIIDKCIFFRITNNCVLFDGASGGSGAVTDNLVSNIQAHFSSSLTAIVNLKNSNRNSLMNIGGEPGGGRVYSFDANTNTNLLMGYDQTPNSSINNGTNNIIGLNGALSVPTLNSTGGSVIVNSLGKRRYGTTTKNYKEITKSDVDTNSASVAFTLSCDADGGLYKHGFVYLICSSQDAATSSSSTAWFLLGATSNTSLAYPSVVTTPKDSGGDTGNYTLSYSAGVLTVAAAGTHDDLIVDIKFGLSAIDNVNIT